MTDLVLDYLKSRKYIFKENFDISVVSSIRSGAVARFYIEPRTADELVSLLEFLDLISYSYTVVGRLTNTLFVGQSYGGAVITTKKMRSILFDGCTAVTEAGATLAELNLAAFRIGLGGNEPLRFIPGSIGGAIIGNAGAHGMEISECIECICAYDTVSKRKLIIDRADIPFEYRCSGLRELPYIVVSSRICFVKKEKADIYRQMRRYLSLREKSQPMRCFSLGSIFKKSGGVSAGYYIDKVGLKGFSIGGATVSDKHAGFIVTSGFTPSSDIIRLIDFIKRRVYEEFDVILEEEINII